MRINYDTPYWLIKKILRKSMMINNENPNDYDMSDIFRHATDAEYINRYFKDIKFITKYKCYFYISVLSKDKSKEYNLISESNTGIILPVLYTDKHKYMERFTVSVDKDKNIKFRYNFDADYKHKNKYKNKRR